jgi:O-antigen/teichoic acid export membrane protein
MYKQIRQSVEKAAFGGGLKAKVFRGGAWLGAGSAAEQTVRFVRNMILTRLLAPEAFGTMAIVLSTNAVIQSFTDIGVRDAIIQNPRGGEREYVGAAWWMTFGRALSIYSLLLLIAPWIARFYGNLELSALLRVTAASVLFEGALSTKAYVALKEMKFSKWAAIFHGGGICGVITTVILSLFIRDVWALVLGNLAEGAARCTLSYIICPFFPIFKWEKKALRELVTFSKGLFGLSFLNFIFSRTDIFVLAKMFPVAQLGLYTMAIYLVQTPTNFILNLMGHVFLPTFSRVQGDKVRTNRIVLQIVKLVMFLGMPALAFVCFCGRSLLTTVYGQRYAAAAAPLVVASCVSIINIVNAQATGVFYANGRPGLHRRCVAIMAILMVLLVYPLATWFGLVGGQLACLISMVVGFLFQVDRIRDFTAINVSEYGKVFLISSLIASSVVVVCLGTRSFVALTRPLPNIALGIVGCLLAYGLTVMILFRGQRGITQNVLFTDP